MMGSLARDDDDYGYSDLGIPIAPMIAPSKVTDYGQADLGRFAMGALAQQDAYRPFRGDIATGTTPWKRYDIEQAQRDTPRDPTGGDPATTKWLAQQAGEMLVPQEPWEWGLAAAGPAGRVAGKLGKIGAVAAGMYGSGVDEAEAAGIKKIGGLLRGGKIPAGFQDVLSYPNANIRDLGHIPKDTHASWLTRYNPDTGAMEFVNTSGNTGHAYSGLKGGDPSVFTRKVVDEPALTHPPIDMAKLQKEKAEMVFGPTDRVQGGGKLVEAGGVKFEQPIDLEGGINFMQMHHDKDIPGVPKDAVPLYASVTQKAANDVNEKAADVLQRGGVPYYVPLIMGHGAGDSAKQTARTVEQALRQAEPNADAIKAIDDAVRAKLGGKDRGYPGFADAEELSAWLQREGLPGRTAFTQGADTANVLKATGVDVGQLRYANIDPRLRDTPAGSGGIVMGRMRPDVGVIDHPLHSNYPKTFMGQRGDIGGMPGNMPFELLGPDIHRALLSQKGPNNTSFASTPAIQVMRGMSAATPKTQPVTQEVVDNYYEWFRRNPSGWMAAGTVPALGALAAQDDYQPKE